MVISLAVAAILTRIPPSSVALAFALSFRSVFVLVLRFQAAFDPHGAQHQTDSGTLQTFQTSDSREIPRVAIQIEVWSDFRCHLPVVLCPVPSACAPLEPMISLYPPSKSVSQTVASARFAAVVAGLPVPVF